ncbi:mannose-1-phosphate guanylyltransferase [Candidatus Woesearchaeota archaeon]|jgi:mannose-1-phosphate guanylyltransferase|nr:mannose-1-phosphate guanylyltransferase [Candidatus Woesearchaeota archaeon]
MVLYAVILAGGVGSRFWPLSRKNLPKQCLNIVGDQSLIQNTVNILNPLISKNNFYISTVDVLSSILKEQVPFANLLIEPSPKNTAACIGFAAIYLLNKDPEATLLIETADHYYEKPAEYLNHLNDAIELTKKNKVVLLGIKPTFPATGFGYIEKENYLSIEPNSNSSVFSIKRFVEKPNENTARSYLNSGNYLWNSGIFISRADVLLEEFKKYLPMHYEQLLKIKSALESCDDEKINESIKQAFESFEKISIDYGIMEKSNNLLVLEGNFPWDDVGSWNSIGRINVPDGVGNVALSEYLSLNSKNNIIYSTEKKLITSIGVSDMIIVETKDSILVCTKKEAEKIKELTNLLKENNNNHLL